MSSRFLIVFSILFFVSCKTDEGVSIPPIDDDDRGPTGSEIPFFVMSSGFNKIVDEPKVAGNMAVYIEQELILQQPIGIEFRGSTSQRLFPKKSYGVETWDEKGEDISISILDFPVEEDWVFNGPYSDKTFLRNVLIFDISNDIGRYASRTRFVEVKVNRDYLGIYVLMEKLKRDKERIAIEKLEAGQTDSGIITGGYILKIDKTSGDTNNPDWPGDFAYSERLGFRSDYNPQGEVISYPPYADKSGEETYFLYEYPKADEINFNQKSYIQNYIKDFEVALINEDFSDPNRAYMKYIDLPSFVDFFILNELSANPDAYRLSTYMHKDRGEKLKMGPIWDFNLAFGNDARSAEQQWIYKFNDRNPADLWLVHFWWLKLLEDPIFKVSVKDRWNQIQSQINPTLINGKIDAWVEYLEVNGAVDRNFERWETEGVPLVFNSFVGASFEEDVEYLKAWYQRRVDWMDSQIQSW